MHDFKSIILTEIQKFIDEDINKGSFIVWHYTKNNPESDEFSLKNELFKPGGGDYYGRGLYASYTWENLIIHNMSKYGEYLIEFKVDNTGKFIIMDYNEAKRIYGNENYDLISQMKRVLGGNFNKIFNKHKDIYLKYNEKLKNAHRTAPILKNIYKYLILNVDGFFYTGNHDGRACVIYNLGIIHPQRYSEDHGKTWKNLPTKNYYNKLKSYDDFSQKLTQIKYKHSEGIKETIKQLIKSKFGTIDLSKSQINDIESVELRAKYYNYFILHIDPSSVKYVLTSMDKFIMGTNHDIAMAINYDDNPVFVDLKGNVNTKDVINNITIDDFNNYIYNYDKKFSGAFIKLKFNINGFYFDKFIYGVNKDINVVGINTYISVPVNFDKGNVINQLSTDDFNTFNSTSRARFLNGKYNSNIFYEVSEFKYGSNKNLAYAIKSNNNKDVIIIDINGIETIKGISNNDLNDIPASKYRTEIYNKIHPNAEISRLSKFIYGKGKYALAIYNDEVVFITFDNKKYNPDYSIINKDEFNNTEDFFRNIIFFKGKYNKNAYVSKTVFKNNTVFFISEFNDNDNFALYKWEDNSKISNIEKFNDYLDYDDFIFLKSAYRDKYTKFLTNLLENILLYNNVNIINHLITNIFFLEEFSGKNPDDFYFLIDGKHPYIVNYKNKKISPKNIKASLLYEYMNKNREYLGRKVVTGYFNAKLLDPESDDYKFLDTISPLNEYVYLLKFEKSDERNIIKDVFDDSVNQNKKFLKFIKKTDLPNFSSYIRMMYFSIILDTKDIYQISEFKYLNNTASFVETYNNNDTAIYDYLGNKIKFGLSDKDIINLSKNAVKYYFSNIFDKEINHNTIFYKLNNDKYRAIISFYDDNNFIIINTKGEDVTDNENLKSILTDNVISDSYNLPDYFKSDFANTIYKTNIFDEIYDVAWNKNDIILVKTSYDYLKVYNLLLFFNYKTNKFTVKGINCNTLVKDASKNNAIVQQYFDIDLSLSDYLLAYFHTKFINTIKFVFSIHTSGNPGVFFITFNFDYLDPKYVPNIENVKYVKCDGDLFDSEYMYIDNLKNLKSV